MAVIGAGSWGTALAQHLGRQGAEVRLWVYEPELLAILQPAAGEYPVLARGEVVPERKLFWRGEGGGQGGRHRRHGSALACLPAGIEFLASGRPFGAHHRRRHQRH